MQRDDAPDTTASSGLSTDDLARPRDTSARESSASPPNGVPTFPGESTDTPGRPSDDEAATTDRGGSEDEVVEADSRGRRQGGQDGHTEDETPQLLTPKDEEGFRARWHEVQNKFVDDPREAVHTADSLVADVMQQLATTFADHKQELEAQWNRGEQANTEDLRQALRHYRAFFNRLLTT
ncbi:hypothetical protein [Streptomyces sp. NPDC000983]|uniref:hypothetical protein n=1 Tax=Streptomyces sp. NPDC000983 TaxID=3154373 RepID=UPI0033319761